MEVDRIWQNVKETAGRHARNKHRLSREGDSGVNS